MPYIYLGWENFSLSKEIYLNFSLYLLVVKVPPNT